MSTTWIAVMAAALLVATGTVIIVAIRLVQALRAVVQLEQHVTRLQEGTNLLTDTVEMGFRQVAAELERLAQAVPAAAAPPARPAQARATTARVKAASGRGRSVREIAAEEQVSEGEVRLRLSLAEAAAKSRARTAAVEEPAPPARSGGRARTRTRTGGSKDATLRA
jgi:hypothetical protein